MNIKLLIFMIENIFKMNLKKSKTDTYNVINLANYC